MKRIAIVVGHPRRDTYCEALARAYADAAKAAGHEVSLFLLAHMEFNPVLREGFERVQPLEPDLQAAHDAILAAEHLVIVFPLWLGGMPALLKGFLERVLQPDVLEPYKQHRFIRLLKGKSARIIVTMGMPAMVYRCWFGGHSVKILRRMILRPMGVGPIWTTLLGRIENVPASTRSRWLQTAARLGSKAL